MYVKTLCMYLLVCMYNTYAHLEKAYSLYNFIFLLEKPLVENNKHLIGGSAAISELILYKSLQIPHIIGIWK